jgi:hypothetical protein
MLSVSREAESSLPAGEVRPPRGKSAGNHHAGGILTGKPSSGPVIGAKSRYHDPASSAILHRSAWMAGPSGKYEIIQAEFESAMWVSKVRMRFGCFAM